MSSYGETDLQIEARNAGRIRLLHVFADNALYPRLGLALGISLDDPTKIEGLPEKLEVRDLVGELRTNEHGGAVGVVRWLERRHSVKPQSYHQEHQLRLICELDPWRLEVLERHRAGGPLQLYLQVWPLVVSGSEPLSATARSFRVSIPREDWLEVVSGMIGSHFDIVEIQYTAREAERFKRAIALTATARKRIGAGEYDSAVAECRKVIEALTMEVRQEFPEEPLNRLFQARTDERRAKEYSGLISKLKQLTGFAIHEFGVPVTYSRGEAQFVLRVTESVLSLVGSLTLPTQPSG